MTINGHLEGLRRASGNWVCCQVFVVQSRVYGAGPYLGSSKCIILLTSSAKELSKVRFIEEDPVLGTMEIGLRSTGSEVCIKVQQGEAVVPRRCLSQVYTKKKWI